MQKQDRHNARGKMGEALWSRLVVASWVGVVAFGAVPHVSGTQQSGDEPSGAEPGSSIVVNATLDLGELIRRPFLSEWVTTNPQPNGTFHGFGTPVPEAFVQRAMRVEPSEVELGAGRETPSISDQFRMNVGRNSSLLDGGIAANGGFGRDPLRGFAGARGDLDLYDLSVSWAALGAGPIELSLTGGVRAIQSTSGMWRTETSPTGSVNPDGTADYSGIIETYDQDRSLVTLPVIGGGVRLELAEGITVSTSATTHTSGSSEAFFDMVMETSISLGRGIGLHAGYQEIRTAIDESGLAEPLDESGLFARLTIEF